MAKGAFWGQNAGVASLVSLQGWLIPSPGPSTLCGLPFDKLPDGFSLQQIHSSVISLPKHHLHDNGYIVGRTEQARMPADTPHHSSALVVYISLDHASAESLVILGRGNLLPAEFFKRLIGKAIKAKRLVKVLAQKFVHRLVYLPLHNSFQDIHPQVRIKIGGFCLPLGDFTEGRF